MIEYRKGDMFKGAPKGGLLVHSCNAQGVWGSGIAKQFKSLFPKSFEEYVAFCNLHHVNAVGKCLKTSENIGCLISSYGYGKYRDSPEHIVKATCVSAIKLAEECGDEEIHSPKINSGLFGVPWDLTAEVLDDVSKEFNKKWVVWDY